MPAWAVPQSDFRVLENTVPHVDPRDLIEKQVTRVEIEFRDGARASATRDAHRHLSTNYTDGWGRSSTLRYRDDLRTASFESEGMMTSQALGPLRPTLLWSVLQLRVLERPRGVDVVAPGHGTLFNVPGAAIDAPPDGAPTVRALRSNGLLFVPQAEPPPPAPRGQEKSAGPVASLASASSPLQLWDQLLAEATMLRVEFGGMDLSVEVSRVAGAGDDRLLAYGDGISEDPVAGDVAGLPAYAARLTQAAEGEMGAIRWYPDGRVLSWNLPNIDQGWVDDSRMPGGIHFNPDMEWAALQGAVFWLDREVYRAQDAEREARRSREAQTTGLPLSIELGSQGMAANTGPGACPTQEAGCDVLGWFLDFLRACCDTHDYCYEYANNAGDGGPGGIAGCTMSSWFFFWRSWQCTRCNIRAVACFLTGTLYNPGPACPR